jgi:ribosome-binding ATPase
LTTKLVIIGLPGSGKTTVFNALSRASAQTGGFGGSDEPNLATVKVPDPRLDLLTEMFNPKRKVPADVQYLDVAGIAKGIAEKGMSGQLLGHLAQGDALVHVVRAFANDDLPHPDGSVDPLRDIETLNLELTFSDLGIIEKRLYRLAAQIPKLRGAEREVYEREQIVMTQLKDALEADTPLRDVVPDLDPDDAKNLRGFGLLTAKPLLILLNTGEDQIGAPSERLVAQASERFVRNGVAVDALAGQIEAEIAQLDDDDAEVFMADLGPSSPSGRTNAGPGRSGRLIPRSKPPARSTATSSAASSARKSSGTAT